ncbi:MAG: hypothetical protein EBZ61_10765 [Micrococcales bacterium]|nr:hypothetical protein [Micrococcales bacterium]
MATPPLNKDVKEVIKEISKAPFGRASKPDKSRPMLTLAETEKAKEAAKKVSPITVKKEAAKLTSAEKDKAIKQIAKERGISYNQAKEALRKELATAPKATPVKQPTVTLPKGIPFRSEIEDIAPRAVTYKGKVIYLTPGQIKQLGLPVDYPETTFGNLFGEDRSQAKKAQDILNREIKDAESVKEEIKLRAEAAKDWSNQARAAATNPQVRDPLEALGKATPDSAKAEAYAERLFQKAYKELSPNERKSIKIIIKEEASRAQKVTRSVVGAQMDKDKVVRQGTTGYYIKEDGTPARARVTGPVPRIPLPPSQLGGLNVLGAIGFAASAFFNYKLMLQQEVERQQQEAMN